MAFRAYKSSSVAAEVPPPRPQDCKPNTPLEHELSQMCELLLAITTEGIFAIDAESECIFVNDSAAAMLGYPAAFLRGRRILDLIQVTSDESHFRRRDGSLLPVRVFSYRWNRDLNGRGVVYVFQDLTEKLRVERELRDAMRRHREVVEHCASGVYQTSREGELLAVNPTLVRLLGFESEQDLRAKDVNDIYFNPQERRDKTAQLERDGSLRNVILTLRRKDGSIIRVVENARAVCDDDGRIMYYEGLLTPLVEE